MRPQTALFGHFKCEFELRLVTSYRGRKKFCTLLVMASTGKSCNRRGGKYCVAGRPNGISCTYGQYTEVKSIHDFPHKEKDKIRYQAWVRFVGGRRPNWSSTNSSVLCSDHFDDMLNMDYQKMCLAL